MQQLSLSYGSSTRIQIAPGPRAAEKQLLAELETLLAAGVDRLAKPILLVVPSATLRRHLLGRLLEERPRGAILGLECRTHLGLAATLLEAAGEPLSPGIVDFDYFALFARRFARRERALAQSLDHLRDGYGAAMAAVRDLLDAGFQPPLLDALDEVLRAEGREVASDDEVERARALLRVAAGTWQELEHWGLGRAAALLSRAAVVVRGRPISYGTVVVHGFNDATGLTIDFLLALVASYGGSVHLDHPPDPADAARTDPGIAFSRNFRERMETGLASGETSVTAEQPALPVIETIRAQGAEAETREVARRVRSLLAAGTRPESVGIVVRRLEDYAAPLRIQFDRLAVPFSADRRCGPFKPEASPLHAVLELLRDGPRLPIERWLDAGSLARGWASRADLLVGLHTVGVGRLADLVELDLESIDDEKGLALPVRRGFTESAEEKGLWHAIRRRLDTKRLERARASARATRDALADWPARATAEEHSQRLDELLRQVFGWSPVKPPWSEPYRELRQAARALPPALEIDFDELQLVLARRLADFGRTALGGDGGGVQVLDVTAARSLTFDHLFLLGLNRGVFPRQVREDPILTDPLRRVLGRSGFGVLPDLPLKRSGFHEERYLFAQLVASSPRVTLSWQEVDDQQKNLRAVSPLVERLLLAAADEGREISEAVARPVFSPPESDSGAKPPWEAAVLAGLGGERNTFERVLAVALGRPGEPASDLAAARVAAVDEADPLFGRGAAALEGLGPWLGSVGPIADENDPRPPSELWVTGLERLAACPWQNLLTRVLRLEEIPDPLETVPGISPRLVGEVVHGALEAIVTRHTGGPDTWREALAADGIEIPWPDDLELSALVLAEARAVVRRRSLVLPGLDRALAAAALPQLENARDLDWPDGSSRWPVIGAEVEGRLDLPLEAGRERRIRFRADRMDRVEDGFSFSDYKTGRWGIGKPGKATAGSRLLEKIRAGTHLQGAVYALAGEGRPGRGRYVYLSPLYQDDVGREFSVASSQPELGAAFGNTVGALLALWDTGGYFPRLVGKDDKEPFLCKYCEVAAACVRGDSGARRRLVRRMAEWSAADELAAELANRVAVWELPTRASRKKGKT